jgi:hypothetical protein
MKHSLILERDKIANAGYVYISKPEEYDLEPNTDSPGKGYRNIYYVSAYHQLHCLNRLHGLIVNVRQEDAVALEEEQWIHAHHCIDYLRQGVV